MPIKVKVRKSIVTIFMNCDYYYSVNWHSEVCKFPKNWKMVLKQKICFITPIMPIKVKVRKSIVTIFMNCDYYYSVNWHGKVSQIQKNWKMVWKQKICFITYYNIL